MLRYDQNTAECFVYTYKEGVLSAVAHDLKLRVGAFWLTVDPQDSAVSASFDPNSMEVVCAMVKGVERAGVLGKRDLKQIQTNITRDVLRTKKFPSLTFQSSSVVPEGEGLRVQGTLSLCGVSRALGCLARREGAHYVAELDLQQPDFGIKPFKALMGTLKVAPGLRIRMCVPAEA